ncbi:DUF3829 domain-containing protein [Rhizobium wenxiniae]|uniref:DUF3829 domain-containing protein n=1 Tax=Rhizobium wenxiniae TaxID=1737357 RepID=UPI003C2200E2
MVTLLYKLIQGALLASLIFVVSCSDEEKVQAKQSSTAQIELLKSNAYISAANVSSGEFVGALADHREKVSPALKTGKPLENYSVVPPHRVTAIRTRLDEAVKREGSIPELDGAAATYLAAVNAFEVVNNSLANYADSKGYLADGGKKARDEDAGYLEALSKVAAAETSFNEAITLRDERLVQEAFDKAPEDSVERYRAGIILHAKGAMKTVTGVFTEPENIENRNQFKGSLTQMATMVEGWDRKIRAEKPAGCSSLQNSFNGFIASGRQALQSAEQGRFSREGGAPPIIIQQEFGIVQMNFAQLINSLNMPHAC